MGSQGETRNLLVENSGGEEDGEILCQAKSDGGDVDWLSVGPAVGLTNFSSVAASLMKAHGHGYAAGCASRNMMTEIKGKLNAADAKVQESIDARRASENHFREATVNFRSLNEQASAAFVQRIRAESTMKGKDAELAKIRNLEAVALERCQVCEKAVSTAREGQLQAEENKQIAE